MDPRQYNFFVTVSRKPAHLFCHVLPAAASNPSSDIRDDAICAELVAAVLNLHIGAGMLRRLLQIQPLILLLLRDIYDLPADSLSLLAYPLLHGRLLILCQYFYQVFFTVIPDHNICTCIHIFSSRLDITAACHDQSLRIAFPGAVQHLP